jgi:hypothetical protein
MNNNTVIFDLGWSHKYKLIQEYYSEYINNEKATNIRTLSGDLHVITDKMFKKDVPGWIIDAFPVEIGIVQLFSIPAGVTGMIHKDGLPRYSTINIPLTGYTEGTMHWYSDSEHLTEVKIDTAYTKVRLVAEELYNTGTRLDLIPDAQSTVTAPSILNTDIWHRIDNKKNTKSRWVASIRFSTNPTFDELKSYY